MDEVTPGEEPEVDSRFPTFSSVDDYIHEQTGELMDLNSEMIQFSRKAVFALEELLMRFTSIVESIREAHAIGAMMTSELTTDMIMEEFAIERSDEEEVEEDE